MKHIFVVHSHITYIASLAVIMHENLSKEDVLLISDGYNLPSNYYKLIPVIVNQSYFPKWKIYSRVRIFLSPVRYLYPIIDEFIKDDCFVAYVPVFHDIKKYVVIHPKCEKFHFIEEGLSSYFESFSLDYYTMENPYPWFYDKGMKGVRERFDVIANCLGANIPRIESIPLFYKSFIGDHERFFYGLSEYSFPGVKNRIIIPITTVANQVSLPSFATNLSNQLLWIGDPDIMAIVGESLYYDCLGTIIPEIVKGKKLYVRFHYRETEEQRNKFIDFLAHQAIEYEIIDDSQIMEFVFLISSKCQVYGVNSSLLIYASVLGHDSYSIIDYFPAFRDSVEKQIPIFKMLVHYLKF